MLQCVTIVPVNQSFLALHCYTHSNDKVMGTFFHNVIVLILNCCWILLTYLEKITFINVEEVGPWFLFDTRLN